MSAHEPSHSIHVAVVRLVDPIIGGVGGNPDDPDLADPDSVAYWGYMINACWSLLAFACIVAMAVVAVSLQLLVSDGAAEVALCSFVFACFFCLAGWANGLWRRYVILPEARRQAQGGERTASQASLRRSLPPNSSVVVRRRSESSRRSSRS